MPTERRMRKWERTARDWLLELVRQVSSANPTRYAEDDDFDIWVRGSRLLWDDVLLGLGELGPVGEDMLHRVALLGEAYARGVAPGAGGVAEDQACILALAGAVLAALPAGFGIEPPLDPAELDFALRDTILADGEELTALFADCGLLEPRLFGSAARGDVDGYSDLDFAAVRDTGVRPRPLRWIALETELSERYGRRTSVMLLDSRTVTRAHADARKGLRLDAEEPVFEFPELDAYIDERDRRLGRRAPDGTIVIHEDDPWWEPPEG